MKATTLTRLQPGMIVMFSGERHVVKMVNESRAFIVPEKRRHVEVKSIEDGKEVIKASFTKPGDGISISPNSEIDIIR